jgi:putative endonuclease
MSKRKYNFYVYIMASESGTLYTDFTNDLYRRVNEHKQKATAGFTSTYSCNKLVYFEHHQYVYNALEREKEIKNLVRSKKEQLIRQINPHWEDLSNKIS